MIAFNYAQLLGPEAETLGSVPQEVHIVSNSNGSTWPGAWSIHFLINSLYHYDVTSRDRIVKNNSIKFEQNLLCREKFDAQLSGFKISDVSMFIIMPKYLLYLVYCISNSFVLLLFSRVSNDHDPQRLNNIFCMRCHILKYVRAWFKPQNEKKM